MSQKAERYSDIIWTSYSKTLEIWVEGIIDRRGHLIANSFTVWFHKHIIKMCYSLSSFIHSNLLGGCLNIRALSFTPPGVKEVIHPLFSGSGVKPQIRQQLRSSVLWPRHKILMGFKLILFSIKTHLSLAGFPFFTEAVNWISMVTTFLFQRAAERIKKKQPLNLSNHYSSIFHFSVICIGS